MSESVGDPRQRQARPVLEAGDNNMSTSRRVVLAGLVVALATASQAGSFTDDFSGGVRPQYWTVEQYHPGFFAFDGSQGDVRFAKVGGEPWSIQGIWAGLNISALSPTGRLPGDFDVQVDFRDAVIPGVGCDQIELHAKFADGYYFFDVRQHGDGRSDVHVWEGIGGNAARGQINTTAAAGTLRIARAGRTLTAWFDDAVVWQNTNATLTDLTSLDFALQNNLYSNDATSVTFDNFRLENGAVSEPTTLALLAIGELAAAGWIVRQRREKGR
jgi:hypothetical protein